MVIILVDMKKIEAVIVNALSKFVKCPVIASNQTAPVPEYPYISYTITTVFVSDDKGFCVSEDGTKYKQFNQIWSFTSQSDNNAESLTNVLKIKDYFDIYILHI